MMRFDALALQIFQKKEELFFYEFFVPKGPSLGPKYGLLGRAGSVERVVKGGMRGHTIQGTNFLSLRAPAWGPKMAFLVGQAV